MVTPICCTRWQKERGSPERALRRRPSSLKKERASGPNTPVVSMPMGMKWCVVCRSAYLAFFCCSACSATNPGSLEAKAMCEGARVSGHVASYTSTRPQLQGMIDVPSGCLPSEQHKPVGSRWAGIPAADKCLWMRLLMLA